MAAEYLILHGWQNRRPDGHWQRWLAHEFSGRGAHVRYPQLPEPDAPVLDDWIGRLERELDGTDPDSLTVVAHSLGCLLWLAYASRRRTRGEEGHVARRVLFVSPPAPEVLRGIPEIAEFALPGGRGDARAAVTAAASQRGVVVSGTDDPYCPEGADRVYAAPLGLEFIPVEGGGHLTMDDGYGPFPLVLELAMK